MDRRYSRNTALDQRLDDAAARLRKEDRGTPLECDSFIRRPCKAETASPTTETLNSPGLRPPVWKNEHDSLLRGMARLGASAARIAEALNSDIDIVRSRAVFLGCHLASLPDQRRLALKQYSLTGRD